MTDLPLAELRGRLDEDAVRAGEDALPGGWEGSLHPPRVALLPGDRDAACEALAILDGRGLSVMPRGGGTATPPLPRPPDVLLLTRRLNRLVDYQPEDMTVTAEAGMPLAALQAVLAERGQVLPIDPAFPDRATVGGVVATNRSGPWRCAYRTPRDWVIGLTVISPDGRAVRGGGRVVKNVAGYDLPRLYTGSRGTLGLIAEVSFKVMPRPPAAALCVAPLAGADLAAAALSRIMGCDLMPTCLELLNRAARRELTGPGSLENAPFLLAVGFEGAGAAVAWQVGALGELLADLAAVETLPEERREAFLGELRGFPARPAGLAAQVNLLSSDVADVAAWCETEAAERGMEVCIAAHAANGVIRLRLPGATIDPARAAAFVEDARAAATARGGSLVVTGGAPEIAGQVDRWGPPVPGAALMRGIREALDPKGTMYTGAFPEW